MISLEELKIFNPNISFWIRNNETNWFPHTHQPKTFEHVVMIEHTYEEDINAAAISLKMENWCKYNCVDEWTSYYFYSNFVFSFKNKRDATLFKMFHA
jgi:hypothetical protein